MGVMQRKILIVEDELALLEAYQMILEKAGYSVNIAHDGEEALTVADAIEPELILLDLRMPRLDGIGFLQRYQLKDQHPHVKVVVFSNLDTQTDIEKAYALGAERYILKAWASPKELLQLVKDTIG